MSPPIALPPPNDWVVNTGVDDSEDDDNDSIGRVGSGDLDDVVEDDGDSDFIDEDVVPPVKEVISKAEMRFQQRLSKLLVLASGLLFFRV